MDNKIIDIIKRLEVDLAGLKANYALDCHAAARGSLQAKKRVAEAKAKISDLESEIRDLELARRHELKLERDAALHEREAGLEQVLASFDAFKSAAKDVQAAIKPLGEAYRLFEQAYLNVRRSASPAAVGLVEVETFVRALQDLSVYQAMIGQAMVSAGLKHVMFHDDGGSDGKMSLSETIEKKKDGANHILGVFIKKAAAEMANADAKDRRAEA